MRALMQTFWLVRQVFAKWAYPVGSQELSLRRPYTIDIHVLLFESIETALYFAPKEIRHLRESPYSENARILTNYI
jgi:hypothetical protein